MGLFRLSGTEDLHYPPAAFGFSTHASITLICTTLSCRSAFSVKLVGLRQSRPRHAAAYLCLRMLESPTVSLFRLFVLVCFKFIAHHYAPNLNNGKRTINPNLYTNQSSISHPVHFITHEFSFVFCRPALRIPTSPVPVLNPFAVMLFQ